METADNTAMHVTETKTLCSSPNCPKTKNEDITREREEELLYGSNEDGDDEDALSDDSFRLRVSDEGEEQQAANRDLTEEVMKQKSTEMELGSDVPSSDITERKSLLKCENLTNGTCTIENHLSHRVEGANEGMHVEDSCNGDIDKSATASIESSKIENSSTDKWHYSGRFGEYSRSEKRNIVPRQSYVMNSCSEKYYNQNTHYGRGKICGKGYSLHNTQGSRVNIEASSPNSTRSNPGISTSPETTIDRSKSKQDADNIASPNMNAECSRVEASSAAHTCSSEFATKLEDVSVACDVLTNITPEPTEILTKNDNAEAAYNCTNNSDSTFQVNQGENISPKAERSSPSIDHEASEVDVDDDKAIVRIINETDSDPPVGESVNATEIHAGEEVSFIRIPLNNVEGEVELPNTVSEVKTEESETFERINENKKFEDTDESTNDGIVSENTRVLENNENLASERNNEMVENEKVTLDGEKAKNHETVATVVTDCVNDKGTESDETYVTINDDRVTSEATSDSENDKITASETPNGFTHDEKATAEKVDECAKPEESMPNSIVTNHEKESPDRDEAEVIKVDDRENDIFESVDETLDQTAKSPDRPTQSESVKEDADGCVEPLVGTSLVSPKMLTNLRALKLPSDLLIVAIVEPKTNEDGSALFPIEPDTAAAPEIPLTDNEKKDCSSGEGDVGDRPSSDRVDNNATMFRCSLKRASTDILLDEMELSKRLQIDRDRGDVTSESGNKAIHCAQVSNVTVQIETTGRKNTSILENTVTNSNKESSDLVPEESIISNNVVEKSSVSERSIEEKRLPAVTESQEIDDDEKVDDCEVIEIPIKRKQKRSRRSLNNLRESIVSQEDPQETENIRQKRKTAQNAEEIIRKECLANTDSESNDSLSKFVTVNHRTNNNLRPTSPPTLKRNFVDDDEAKDVGTTTKKLKADATLNGDISTNNESVESETKRTLQHVRNFFRRDANGSLCKLMQEELEELLIQKVVETITMKGEIGKLREQAKAAERNQEATRIRCQQLAKQIKDLDMVLNRFKSDLRSNPDSKTVVPIKINRSVGLQVNFVTDHGIQNLRQLQQVQKMTGSTVDGTIVLQQQMQQQKQPAQQPQPLSEPTASGPVVKRTVKVRSPRRPEHPSTAPVATAVSTSVNSPHVSSVTPAALVVSKPVSDSRPSVTPANQQITVMHPQLISSNQAILVNGNVTSQPIRQAPTLQASKAKNSDLIDLTQEEEKTKPPMVAQNTVLTAALAETSSSVSNVQKLTPRYHSVIQTIPNMSITTQSGIRVVQPSSQPTPTALVNNMNAPRLTYVTMQSGIVPRQVVLTSAPTPIRPAPTNNIRTTFPISGTITNNTVRVIPATGTTTLLYKHPAALPESLNPLSSPSWKLPPPAPSLKISKVANGIVLSWNMALSDKFADIASYQLYAYQELTGMAPSSTLWKKVGDVRALPLPMACTLTQFSEGNNYYFAVRAVDKHSRLGQYSQPGNISL